MRKEVVIMIVIAVILVGLGILLSRSGTGNKISSSTDNQALVRASSHMTGKAGAKVTVVEFGDYQCPACGEAEPVVEQVIAAYKNNPDFNFVFRNFPLPQHGNAMISAEAAEAAAEQGKFWEMHNKLYQTQNDWADNASPLSLFAGYAQQLGLDVNKFQQEVQQNKFSGTISADQTDGLALNVNSTPTFFINGQAHPGVLTFDQFKSLIDPLLNSK